MKEILLTQGKIALVDNEDFDRVSRFKWYAQRGRKTFYAYRAVPGTNEESRLSMHSFLLGVGKVDHRDGNGLNNQKENLRPATESQNRRNQKKQSGCSSIYKGVTWHKRQKIWAAQIRCEKSTIHLGVYESEVDAAHAYDYAAKLYFGEFARLNFP